MTITTEEAERLAQRLETNSWRHGNPVVFYPEPSGGVFINGVFRGNTAAALRSLAAERDALQARVAKLEMLGKSLMTERNQLIGVLQLAVEQSGETGENEPAWLGPACRILNAGFTKIVALEEKEDSPTMTEGQLREMMRDPRYWRQRNPEWVKRVTDGFRALVGGKKDE